MRDHAVDALNQDDGNVQRNGNREGAAVTRGGCVVVMVVAALGVAMTMTVRTAAVVVARVVVFARRVRVARLSVCGIVIVVMVSAVVAGVVGVVMARAVVAGIVAVVMARTVVAGIVAVVMVRMLVAAIVGMVMIMARVAQPGQRPQGICG
jgi:hypothetical protein